MSGKIREHEFFFPDLNKNVMVQVYDGVSLTETFNEVSHFIKTLIANHQLKDDELGLNPQGATWQVAMEADQHYRLRRLRANSIS